MNISFLHLYTRVYNSLCLGFVICYYLCTNVCTFQVHTQVGYLIVLLNLNRSKVWQRSYVWGEGCWHCHSINSVYSVNILCGTFSFIINKHID